MKRPVFLITSGPTREYIDPVRYISNASSGRMGAALAKAAKRFGKVIVITGPADVKPPEGVAVVPVMSAREMFEKVKECLPEADIIIGAAAVADYRPAVQRYQKIKKSKLELVLTLMPNPDIIGYVGRHKEGRVAAGFALETEFLVPRAKAKLEEKGLDMIVANSPESIGGERSSVVIISSDGAVAHLRDTGKKEVAEKIIHETIRLWKARPADETVY